jgi:hypothetical protein
MSQGGEEECSPLHEQLAVGVDQIALRQLPIFGLQSMGPQDSETQREVHAPGFLAEVFSLVVIIVADIWPMVATTLACSVIDRFGEVLDSLLGGESFFSKEALCA